MACGNERMKTPGATESSVPEGGFGRLLLNALNKKAGTWASVCRGRGWGSHELVSNGQQNALHCKLHWLLVGHLLSGPPQSASHSTAHFTATERAGQLVIYICFPE